MNKVVLIGRLVKDAELKFTPGSGVATATVTLAVDKWNSKEKKNEADFISVVFWNKNAENICNYCSKGSLIAVEGRISTRSYDAKDGTKRYVTEVVCNELKFLDSKKNEGFTPNVNNNFGVDFEPVDTDLDIPF